jgi:hypothetical protein
VRPKDVTPGSWTVEDNEFTSRCYVLANGDEVASLGTKAPGLAWANAHLVAASPDLYEAGQQVLDALRAGPEGKFYDLPMPWQKQMTRAWLALEEALEKAEADS